MSTPRPHSLTLSQGEFFGPSDYKDHLDPVGHPIVDYDAYQQARAREPSAGDMGKKEFRAHFGDSWAAESWKKDVMVTQKISELDQSGGRDKVITGGLDVSDTYGARGPRSQNKSHWDANGPGKW